MKTILLSGTTAIYIVVLLLSRHDLDAQIFMTAMYSLVSYWVVTRTKGTLHIFYLDEIFLVKLFLITAYFILNFFVIRNAIEFNGLHIVYAIAFLIVTTILIVLKFRIIRDVRFDEENNT